MKTLPTERTYRNKILIVDDSLTVREILNMALSDNGYELSFAVNGGEAISKAIEINPDLTLLDLMLPDMDGNEVLEYFKRNNINSVVIMITGHASIDSAIESMKKGVYDYVQKPFDTEKLKMVIKKGLEKRELEKQNENLLKELQMANEQLLMTQSEITRMNQELEEKVINQTKELRIANKNLLIDAQIITEVNELLDKNLFNLSLQDKVRKAFSSVLDIKNSFINFFNTIANVIEYKFGSILLVSGEEVKIYLFSPSYRFSKRLLEQIVALNLNSSLFSKFNIPESYKIEPKILILGNYRGKKDTTPLKFSIFSKGISSHNKLHGFISLMKIDKGFSGEEKGNVSLMVNTSALEIENMLLYKKMERLSVVDSLTSLYVHRYFHTKLDEEIKRAIRYNTPLSLMMIDVDDFKRINDTYGHQIGDQVLAKIASIIKLLVRKMDITARYGGEEFAILLPQTTIDDAGVMAKRILNELRNNDFKDSGNILKLTVSIGISAFKQGINKSVLIEQADAAMYKAKKSGKNRVVFAQGGNK